MKKKTYNLFIIFIILIFILFYSNFINHGLPYFLNNDEGAFLKSTLFFFNFFSSNYKYLSDPFYSPLFNFIGSSAIAVIDAIKNNNLTNIKNHIYFNPDALITYGRFTSLIVCSLSLVIVSAILNKLKINRLIILNLIISIAFCLFFVDIAITNGKNSFYLFFFLIQYYFFLKYFLKIQKLNKISYLIFGLLGAFAWGINYFCSLVAITSILILHYKKYKFNELYNLIIFFIIFLLIGFIPNFIFNETSTLWHWIDISNSNNYTFTDRIYKFQSSVIRGAKILYFTEKYYLFLFLATFSFFLKSNKSQHRALFFFSVIILLEPLILLTVAKRAFPQLKYFSASIVLMYILFGLGLNEILKIYKKKIIIGFFIFINFFIIIMKFNQINSVLNVISVKNNFYKVYEGEFENVEKTIFYKPQILIRKNLKNLKLYKRLYANNLIKEKWHLKDNLDSLNLKIKRFDNNLIKIYPEDLKEINVMENTFEFSNPEKLFRYLKKKEGFLFVVIPETDKERNDNVDSIIQFVEKNFEIINYYKGNNMITARDVVEEVYLGNIKNLKDKKNIGYPYKVYRITN